MSHKPTLIVITGPTGVGKTDAAIAVARRLQCHIVNADSRQVYRGIPIGTAAPTPEQRALVPHHLVEFKRLEENYSAALFEADVMSLLPQLWQQSHCAVLAGGAMLYVDAVCNGIDAMPDIAAPLRRHLKQRLEDEGLAPLLAELERLDPAYFAQVDKQNHKRVIHALEVCMQTGKPFSSFRTGMRKQRPFNIIKVGLNIARPQLFDRINRRVDNMIEQGLEQEARSVYHLRELNSLNTVGYKEMFAWFDGNMDFVTARERIKKNTRVYAKKQLTWYARDPDITWCEPHDALATVERLLKQG